MIKQLMIQKFASIRQPITVHFGTNTVLLGPNATGKTAICDALHFLFNYDVLFERSQGRLSGDVAYAEALLGNPGHKATTVKREVRFCNSRLSTDSLFLDSARTQDFDVLSALLKVVYWRDSELRDIRTSLEVAKFCHRLMTRWTRGLSQHHFASLRDFLGDLYSAPNRLIEGLEWQDNGKLSVKLWSKRQWRLFDDLSTSEALVAITEIAICMGQRFCRYRPTIVVLDSLASFLDGKQVELLARRLNSITSPALQFLLTTWKAEYAERPEWDCLVRLAPKPVNGGATAITEITRRTPKGVSDYEELITRYASGDEDPFINTVVLPLLRKLNFSRVQRVPHHGPFELGVDIGPFVGEGIEWRQSLCGAQVKSAKLNATSGSSNSVNALIDEVKKALNNKFQDPATARLSNLDYVLVFLSQYPTREALHTLQSAFDGDRRVVLFDPAAIAQLLWQHGIPLY
jgi:hypothetical protein